MRTSIQAYNDAFARAINLGLPPERAFALAQNARSRQAQLNERLREREAADLVDDSVDTTRDLLNRAGKKRWGGEGVHVYVQDFGNSHAVFEVWRSDGGEEQLYRVTWKLDGGEVVLSEDETQVEVHHQRRYVEVAEARERAFVIEENGRMFFTARASLFAEQAAAASGGPGMNPGFTYISGRFVGAEKANRNNAMWTTGDLEFGAPTVSYGPLTWLHDERQIVGAIADSKLVTPSLAEQANELVDPYIAAAAVFWHFMYPQQAGVVEQASADEKLWFSMECVSREVSCVDHDCGSFPWAEHAAKTTCDHIRERSGRLRFKDPIFLGGALIVPPVAPGWADANASIMERAHVLSEKAFDQAGKPDVPSSEWERVVGRVLEYAAG